MGAEKKTDVLLLTINFPEMVSDGTQRGSYLFKVARTLSEETGTRIQVLCFRFRNQEPFEELDGLSVRRIEIPYKSKNDMSPESPKWEDLIPPETHRRALSEFAERACQLADTIGHTVPVWCHEMITYSAAAELRKRGYPVVCVLHGPVRSGPYAAFGDGR